MWYWIIGGAVALYLLSQSSAGASGQATSGEGIAMASTAQLAELGWKLSARFNLNEIVPVTQDPATGRVEWGPVYNDNKSPTTHCLTPDSPCSSGFSQAASYPSYEGATESINSLSGWY